MSVASAVRRAARERETGSCRAKPMGGKTSRLVPHRDWLLARLSAKGATLRKVQAELGARGIRIGYARPSFSSTGAFRRVVRHAAEQDRRDVARRRAQWRKHQGRVAPTRLVFIDETGAATNMARLRGWGPKGIRLVEKAPCAFAGAINGPSFPAYVRPAIRSAGAKLFFLPPCSPDLQPIDPVFAKLKHRLRTAGERTVAATWCRIGTLLDDFTPDECANYLRNAGDASASTGFALVTTHSRAEGGRCGHYRSRLA